MDPSKPITKACCGQNISNELILDISIMQKPFVSQQPTKWAAIKPSEGGKKNEEYFKAFKRRSENATLRLITMSKTLCVVVLKTACFCLARGEEESIVVKMK